MADNYRLFSYFCSAFMSNLKHILEKLITVVHYS